MKQKMSISIEEKTVAQLDKFIIEGKFRNKSHLIEYSINKFLKEKENE